MATLTFEEELMNAPTYDYRTESPKQSRPSFSELLGILNYNQGLVEFADSKAGSLILLNSLLIAAVGALPSSGDLGAFKLISVALCSAAVYYCFQVISSKEAKPQPGNMRRKRQSEDWERDDFLFFGCISKHKSGSEFCQAFEESNAEDRQRALLQRTYVISQIADRKFVQYKAAQKITSVALGVWVLVNLLPFLAAG
jgi:hypothetical protein